MTSLKGLKPKTISLGNKKKYAKKAKENLRLTSKSTYLFFTDMLSIFMKKSKALLKNLKSSKLLNYPAIVSRICKH